MEFKLVWDHHKGNSEFVEKTTIVQCSYSKALGFIATAGVEGKLHMYDASAKVLLAEKHKHHAEILGLFFYDSHHQLISISKDRVVILWDANTLKQIQTFNDSGFPTKNYTTTAFFPRIGRAIVASISGQGVQVEGQRTRGTTVATDGGVAGRR